MRINAITISGRLTRDPEIRLTSNGKELTVFSIAHGKPYKVEDEWQEETSFFNIKTMRKVKAEKGDMVVVTGELSAVKNEKGVWVEIFATQIMQPWKKRSENAPDSYPPEQKPEETKINNDDIPF